MARKVEPAKNNGQVYGYIRVSTEDQALNGYGLDAQEASVRAYCRAMGWELAGIVRDEGFSGAKLDRPGITHLRTLAQNGQLGKIVVYKLDRLSRRLLDILTVVEAEFEPKGVSVVSVQEQFDTSTPTGRMFFQLMGSFAEFEREVIRERLMRGRAQKRACHGYAGGAAPLGLRAVRKSGTLHPTAKLPAALRTLALKDANPDWSLRQIAEALNQEGHTTAEGKRFTAVQVNRILKNQQHYEAYRG